MPVELGTSTMCAAFHASAPVSASGSRSLGPARGPRRAGPTPPAEVAARIDDTVEGWRSWEAEHDVYEGPHRELVRIARAC